MNLRSSSETYADYVLLKQIKTLNFPTWLLVVGLSPTLS